MDGETAFLVETQLIGEFGLEVRRQEFRVWLRYILPEAYQIKFFFFFFHLSNEDSSTLLSSSLAVL